MPDVKAKCPVCDMDVDKATGIKADYKGQSYYFCSSSDKDKFMGRPDKYIGKQHIGKTKAA